MHTRLERIEGVSHTKSCLKVLHLQYIRHGFVCLQCVLECSMEFAMPSCIAGLAADSYISLHFALDDLQMCMCVYTFILILFVCLRRGLGLLMCIYTLVSISVCVFRYSH